MCPVPEPLWLFISMYLSDSAWLCLFFEEIPVLVEPALLSGVDPVLSFALLCSQRVNGAVCEYGLPAGLRAGAGEAV